MGATDISKEQCAGLNPPPPQWTTPFISSFGNTFPTKTKIKLCGKVISSFLED